MALEDRKGKKGGSPVILVRDMQSFSMKLDSVEQGKGMMAFYSIQGAFRREGSELAWIVLLYARPFTNRISFYPHFEMMMTVPVAQMKTVRQGKNQPVLGSTWLLERVSLASDPSSWHRAT